MSSNMAVAGKSVVDKRQSGNFRHSVFIKDTFDFLDDFEEKNLDFDDAFGKTSQCGPPISDFDSNYTRGTDANDRDISTDINPVIEGRGTQGVILNTVQSATNIESNSSANVNGCESAGIGPNGNDPNEDNVGGHIDYAPSRRMNQVKQADSEDGANKNSHPAKEFCENEQNGTSQSLESSSGLIRDSNMPGCHGNCGVGDELGIGTLTEGKTNGIASHSCGVGTDVGLDAQGTMCTDNMDGLSAGTKDIPGPKDRLNSDSKGVTRSISSQDKHVLTDRNKNCDNSDPALKTIPGSVSLPSNLECSSGPTMTDDVITKSDDVTDVTSNVVVSADQNCDDVLKGEVSSLCDSEKNQNGCTGSGVKNGVRINGADENVESNGTNGVVKNVELNGTKQITLDESNSDDGGVMKRSVDSDLDSEVKVVLRRSAANSPSRFSESSSRGTSDDEDDDEDAGVYSETHRYSHWMFADDEGKLHMTPVIFEDGGSDDTGSTEDTFNTHSEDISYERTHRRLESQSSTASEREFKRKYQHVSRKVVKRKSSLQAYERMSERICEPEHRAVLTRESNDQDFGFHIKGSQPAYISTVVPGSIADDAGVLPKEIIVSVNSVHCMGATHDEVLELLLKEPNTVVLELSKPNSNPDDGSDEPIMTGYLMKQAGAGLLKSWRRRYFVLKRDHCLYYYKTQTEKDPLGAILLSNYMIHKVSDTGIMGRKHSFKAVKYGAKSYYFAAESEQDMINWANALNEQAKSAGRTDTWLDISSPNVDISALSIKNPDCHGNLCKLGIKRRHWRRRYCVLKDACIYFYLDVNANTAQGVAHLHGYTVLDSSPHSRKFTFTLKPPEERMRTFFFSTENETDLHRWTSSLRKSINRWMKTE